jgi:chemotaxis response regulator CheB
MAKEAIELGAAEKIVPLGGISAEIMRLQQVCERAAG